MYHSNFSTDFVEMQCKFESQVWQQAGKTKITWATHT